MNAQLLCIRMSPQRQAPEAGHISPCACPGLPHLGIIPRPFGPVEAGRSPDGGVGQHRSLEAAVGVALREEGAGQ